MELHSIESGGSFCCGNDSNCAGGCECQCHSLRKALEQIIDCYSARRRQALLWAPLSIARTALGVSESTEIRHTVSADEQRK